MSESIKTPKAPKAKSSIKFVGQNGQLQIVINRIAPNNVQTFVVHTKLDASQLTSKGKPKKLRTRGASELHKDEATAKVAVDKLVAQAVKIGWSAKSRVKKVKVDTFTLETLPTPSMAPRIAPKK